jgi:UDP-2,3-diacylglucosamine hydrolase
MQVVEMGFFSGSIQPSGIQFLGTPIASMVLKGEEEILFLSDLHLRPEEKDKIEAFEALLQSRTSGSKVFILGDLFDFWVGAAQGRAPGWRDLLRILQKESQRGLEILILHGNRDFQLGLAFEKATGTKVWPGGIQLEKEGGQRLLCLHGDELCLADLRYQKAKKRLRSWPVKTLLRSLPFSLSHKLADRARAKSQMVLEETAAENMLPTQESFLALREEKKLFPCDLLFGHIHLASHGEIPGEGERKNFFVLPSFEAKEAGHALLRPKGLVLILQGMEDVSFGSLLRIPKANE